MEQLSILSSQSGLLLPSKFHLKLRQGECQSDNSIPLEILYPDVFFGVLCLTYHSQDPVGFVSAAFWRGWGAVQKVLPQPASLGGITAGDRYKLLQQV